MSLPRTPPSRQTVRVEYDANDDPIFQGWAYPDTDGTTSTAAAIWRIARYTWVGGNMVLKEWADGDDLYNNIWDNRAALAYS